MSAPCAGPVALALAALALAGCGGGERQDAGAPSGAFQLDVVRASFPPRQSVGQSTSLQLEVENTGDRGVPQLAVTVRTRGRGTRGAASAFGQASDAPDLADAARPVWIVDQGPRGGDSAYTDTWAVGPLGDGATRTLRWRVTAMVPGRYTVLWRLAPALAGDAELTGDGRTAGAFRVRIGDAPVGARD
jgi:hypothetical protein